MKNTMVIIGGLAVVLCVLVIAYVAINNNDQLDTHMADVDPARTQIADISYACEEERTISAVFFEGEDLEVDQPGEMPNPTGSVELQLSDGRALDLAQTISASGVRYANEDESFVFWNKGNTAFVMEGDEETFANCIEN